MVEDLYRPYRPKRRTRATIAQEKGLAPLSDTIMLQMTKEPVEKLALAYISEEKGVATVEEAINGAKDILAERISNLLHRSYNLHSQNFFRLSPIQSQNTMASCFLDALFILVIHFVN